MGDAVTFIWDELGVSERSDKGHHRAVTWLSLEKLLKRPEKRAFVRREAGTPQSSQMQTGWQMWVLLQMWLR